ncbi:MAG: NADP-dependent oxidoreductase [Bacteroidales bacterium]|nr:NADP-dependent oxidoreductase [Bacteroidales bacterium]
MKALQITGYGTMQDNLCIRNIQLPEITDDEVLIEIYAASLNPHDYKTIQGKFRKMEKLTFPAQIGGDASGVIIKKGKNVKGFKTGDEVFGIVHGSVAEYGKTIEAHIVKKPANITHFEASGFPIVGMTTIQAFEYAKIKPGDKVFIHAGSGGIGSFAIQYAKNKGAFVYTTTSTNNVDLVRRLGADVVINYKKENYMNVAKDIDIVYDTLGEQYTFDAFKIIKNGGSVVSILPSEINKEVATELGLPSFVKFIFSLRSGKIERLRRIKNVFYKFLFLKVNRTENLLEISQLAEQHKIKAVIDKVFDFEESIAAFQYLSTGRAKGKVIIKIK